MREDLRPSLLCMWMIAASIPMDDLYYNFSWIEGDTNIGRDRIRSNIKELRKRGYVEFARGLMNDDGEVQGAGYALTKAGAEWLSSLKLCETCHRPRLIHACATCSPGWPIASDYGKGCHNCRNSGCDQTPCKEPADPGRLA